MARGGMWLTTLLVLLPPLDAQQEACVDDDSTTDFVNGTCGNRFYDFYPSGCGYYDDDDFSSFQQCCACQGIWRAWNLSKGCVNNDTTTDIDGYSCFASGVYYWEAPSTCGYYDDDDFTAGEHCCACGGGTKQVDMPFCGYGEEECRRAAAALGLALGAPWANGSFASPNKSEDGCYTWGYGYWAGGAYYGLLDDGSEPRGDAQLPDVKAPKVRLPGKHSCGPTPAPVPAPAPAADASVPPHNAALAPAPAPAPAPVAAGAGGSKAAAGAEGSEEPVKGGLASSAWPARPPLAMARACALLLLAGS